MAPLRRTCCRLSCGRLTWFEHPRPQAAPVVGSPRSVACWRCQLLLSPARRAGVLLNSASLRCVTERSRRQTHSFHSFFTLLRGFAGAMLQQVSLRVARIAYALAGSVGARGCRCREGVATPWPPAGLASSPAFRERMYSCAGRKHRPTSARKA